MFGNVRKPFGHIGKPFLKRGKGCFDLAAQTVKVAADIGHAFAQSLCDFRQVNQIDRLVGALHGALGQIADFLGDNGKAPPVIPGPGRFDGSIECQKFDALADILDRAQNLVGAFGLGFKFGADAFKIGADGVGLAGNG